MNVRFIKISLGICIFLFISFFGFKFMLGDRKEYYDGFIDVPKLSIAYSGFEEEDEVYKIKVSFKNNSKYYGSLRDVKLQFSNNNLINSNPIFIGYDFSEREYFDGNEESNIDYSPFLDKEGKKEYVFDIPKGLNFDNKIFDTNRMRVSYNLEYYKYKPKSNSLIGKVKFDSSTEFIDNSSMPFTIE
ncbi:MULTISPECIES: hypothetical protein [unclassified Clostridium]|uniref:hypothetical protein n=1 Tax=unclassified Clostridium TaxID=2614128 RepID=UPI00189C3078|nr:MULTISPECIES: hypothetical protein [unclassified Clostridium]MCR1952415.1 hypothetical protein [Clostridium sp. DSM 100503]